MTVIGLFQVGWAARDSLLSGGFQDARTSLELSLRLDQGIVSAFFGGALAIGGFYIDRTRTRGTRNPNAAGTPLDKYWHRNLLALAVLLMLGVVVLSVLPTPSQAIAYAPRDFDPLAQPTNLTTYGVYYVARPRLGLWADRGSVLNVDVQITWTDNRTGAVLFGGAPGNFTVYAASASSPRESPMIASSFVAPSNAFYVLVVWLGRCATPTTGQCANTTVAVQAQVLVTVPTIYLPAQIGGSVVGPVLVAISAAGARAAFKRMSPHD